MSATITIQPNGRRLVTCDQCHAQADTPFVDVAHKWSRDHKCEPTRGGAA